MKRQPERVFVFRLAKELGMTVRRLLKELDSRELAEWVAFARVDRELDEESRLANEKLKASNELFDNLKRLSDKK